ncbi:PEGA domain-containing protein [Candidatus Collierbacteria bacterium]|nr:PEGA domain-containing protein [Candidatus Collierbacteria bacterium]
MKRSLFRILPLLFLPLILSACTSPLSVFGKKAGIQVTSNPQANVFIDDKPQGQTPALLEDQKPGTYTIKIIPNDLTLQPWEGKVTLNSGVLTIVDRQLAQSPDKAHGHTLSFEKLPDKNATQVHIITSPDTVSVTVDGTPRGFTPSPLDSIEAGGHTFTLTSPGYQDKVVKASVFAGYRLIINATLAAQAIATPSPTPDLSPSPIATSTPTPSPTKKAEITPLPKQATSSAVAKPYVEILTTPTGWLRVRSDPVVEDDPSNEVAKANPGDRYPFLSQDASQKWFQIEYQKDKKGWISSTYAKLVQ